MSTLGLWTLQSTVGKLHGSYISLLLSQDTLAKKNFMQIAFILKKQEGSILYLLSANTISL